METEWSPTKEDGWSPEEEAPMKRSLPPDLPKTLDDRQPIRNYGAETEFYDAWQGQSQIISSPPTQPLAFNLNLNDDTHEEDVTQSLQDNDSRLMEMLAAQAAHRGDSSAGADEEAIVNDKKIPVAQKKALLQKALHNAASNGDLEQIDRLLNGPAKSLIDINGPDEEGTAPIIYASCFVSGSSSQA